VRIGDVHLHPVSDGTFVARPRYFGDHLADGSRPELFDRHRAAWLPIGCFLIRTGDRLVLVDAGLGPELQEVPPGMRLVGGLLDPAARLRPIGSQTTVADGRTVGAGAHFPELRFGRVLTGTGRRRWV
jgi:hypothetical protein